MIYFDNAATTFKKPKAVLKAVNECLKKYCANSARSSHTLAIKTGERIYEAREKISAFLNIDMPERVVFSLNATYALNFAIKSLVSPGDHLIISDVEHNAVRRPVHSVSESLGVKYSVYNTSGDIEENISSLKEQNTKFIVSTLASNVTGREISLEKLSKTAKKLGVGLIVDASQLIGHRAIDLKATPCDVLCAPSHKALFGIQGAGFAVFLNDSVKRSVIEGGSGSHSALMEMPGVLPDMLEAGTLPSPSIISLIPAINFIEKIGIDSIENHIYKLSAAINERLSQFKEICVYDGDNGVISFNISGVPASIVGDILNKEGVCVRTGLHCAPMAHNKIGTQNIGTVRISLSYFNTKREIDSFYKIMRHIIKKYI